MTQIFFCTNFKCIFDRLAYVETGTIMMLAIFELFPLIKDKVEDYRLNSTGFSKKSKSWIFTDNF